MARLSAFTPDLTTEWSLRASGHALIAGLDEAGRGAWAGPVVAAAVILPLDRPDLAQVLAGVRDSKRLSPAARANWHSQIQKVALGTGVGMASSWEVDELGIVPATRLAMLRALHALPLQPDALVLDWLTLPDCPLPQVAFQHADVSCLSVAAASVVAKVSRDELMAQLDRDYPGYHFARHKGYGTAQHRAALEALGPTAIHRRSFAPIRWQVGTSEVPVT